MSTLTVLICGDRNWTNRRLVEETLATLHGELGYERLLHGAAPGADTLAAQIAAGQGWEHVSGFPAQWRQYGRGAGPIRNRLMLKQHPDLVIAFHDNLEQSKGTKDMHQQAMRAGVPTLLLTTRHGGIAQALVRTSAPRTPRPPEPTQKEEPTS